MSDATSPDAARDLSREEMMSALFGHMVIQNTNMALMFLGLVPHPETGEHIRDLDAARMFIEQIEMLEAKTKGNLTPDETKLLQQSLTHLRMTFFEAVEHPLQETSAAEPKAATAPETNPTLPAAGPAPAPAAPAEEESRKRFTKKF